MPSPFPGMDPYLEDPMRWPNVHHQLIGQLSDSLNAVLPDAYVAVVQERLVVEDSGRSIYPDVRVLSTNTASSTKASTTATLAAPAWEVDLLSDPQTQGYIEIVPADDQSRVVTVLEILSPVSKTGTGRGEYLKKQEEILESAVHLIEIDLLRSGTHTISAPLGVLHRFGSWDYLVSLSRADRRSDWQVWAVTIRQRLPRILVPLDPGTDEVVLDVQASFERVYDLGRFSRVVDYSREPCPPLGAADMEWSAGLLGR